jgi:hypothetical protein
MRKYCPNSGRSVLFYQFTKRAIKLIVVIIVDYHCFKLLTNCCPLSSKCSVHIQVKLLGIMIVDFDITRLFAFAR